MSAYRKITDLSALNKPELAEEIIEVFRLTMPLNDYFHGVVNKVEADKIKEKLELLSTEETTDLSGVKAPDVEFMW